MLIVDIIEYGLAIFVGAFIAYRLLLSLFSLRTNGNTDFKASRRRKFALVIPSGHDESVNNRTLYSLFGILYPQNMYDIYVVTDTGRNNSLDLASSLGAYVLIPDGQYKNTNGYTLGWVFETILSRQPDYEAIAVIQSGSLVSGNYLEVMNYYMEQGSRVVQSSSRTINQQGFWKPEVHPIRGIMGYLGMGIGRRGNSLALGFEANLRDNGTCLGVDLLREVHWQSSEITSYAEYILQLQLDEIPIDFAPEATVWRPVPSRFQANGVEIPLLVQKPLRIIRKYAPRLLTAAVKKRSIRLFESFIDLITPSPAALLVFVIAVTVINGVSWGLGWLPFTYLLVWLTITVIGFIHYMVMVLNSDSDLDHLPISTAT